jgi:hypothetical protein
MRSPNSPRPVNSPRMLVLVLTCLGLVGVFAAPEQAEAVLRNAAGGTGGGGGFATLTRYLDRLATFLIPVGGAAAAIGVIIGGVQFIAGNPAAMKTLGYVAVGVVVVLGSKGLAA